MAGDENRRCTGPLPQIVQVSTGGSENFRISSKRPLHAAHSYSYSGIVAYLLQDGIRGVAEQQPAMGPERSVALRQDGIMERAHRELAVLRLFVIAAQLQEHQLPYGVHQIGRVEGSALGL